MLEIHKLLVSIGIYISYRYELGRANFEENISATSIESRRGIRAV